MTHYEKLLEERRFEAFRCVGALEGLIRTGVTDNAAALAALRDFDHLTALMDAEWEKAKEAA